MLKFGSLFSQLACEEGQLMLLFHLFSWEKGLHEQIIVGTKLFKNNQTISECLVAHLRCVKNIQSETLFHRWADRHRSDEDRETKTPKRRNKKKYIESRGERRKEEDIDRAG